MKNVLKGGIETIIAVIILTGLVVALIISSVLPIADDTIELGDKGQGKLSSLEDAINEG